MLLQWVCQKLVSLVIATVILDLSFGSAWDLDVSSVPDWENEQGKEKLDAFSLTFG